MSFNEDMKEGGRTREQGDFAAALVHYENAIEHAPSTMDGYEANIQFAVTLRLAGALDRALSVFAEALESMGDEVSPTRARCHRDYGMALLERHLQVGDLTFLAARDELIASIDAYVELGDAIEEAISWGFLGRYYLVTGNRQHAIKLLRGTHRQISGQNDSGERDNIVWLARASLLWRWLYMARALKITAGTRRRQEYMVLLVGGEWLYDWLRARRE